MSVVVPGLESSLAKAQSPEDSVHDTTATNLYVAE